MGVVVNVLLGSFGGLKAIQLRGHKRVLESQADIPAKWGRANCGNVNDYNCPICLCDRAEKRWDLRQSSAGTGRVVAELSVAME